MDIAKWQHVPEKDLFITFDSAQNNWIPNDNTFVRFSQYLHQCHTEVGVQKSQMHFSNLKKAFAWMRMKLNAYLQQQGTTEKPEGYILTLPGVRCVYDTIRAGDRMQGMIQMMDIQALLEVGITPTQMLDMVYILWQRRLPAETRVGSVVRSSPMSDLYQYSILYEMRASHQTQQRHNDLQSEMLCHNFTRPRHDLGPNGSNAYCQMSNGGKTNANHNMTFTIILRHRNPILCALFAKGALFLHRYMFMAEQLPNWQQRLDMFQTRTLRQPGDRTKAPAYRTLNCAFHRLYAMAGIICQKVLHQGRRQGQQEMFDSGITMLDIQYWCKYVYSTQGLSYILNVPIAPPLQRAGFDPDHPEHYQAAHFTVDVSHLVKDLLPDLVKYEDEVKQAFLRAHATLL